MGGRRRRRSPSPPFLLASLLAPQGALAAPILPFLYPPSSFALPPHPSPSSSASASSSRPPRQSRSKRTRRTPHDETSPTAEKIAFKYRPGHDGRFSPECWSLLGQSNCARNHEHHDETEGNLLAEDAVIVDAPLAVDAAATNTTASSTTPTTTTTTSVTTSSSTSTVKPYTMAFEVTNIPPGWQKSSRTHFYSKNVVIGFSVSLAVLIIATIVGCVIWRIKVARSRRDAEKALKRKKAQIARDYRSRPGHPYASDSDDQDDDARTQRTDERSSLGETTRQRGLRRRRRNTRAPDDDPAAAAEVSSEKTESVSSRSRPWSKKWKLVRRPKWARIPTGRKLEVEEKEDVRADEEDQPLPDPALSIALRIPLPISPPPSPTSLTAPLPTPPSPPPPPPPPPPLILVTSTEVSPPAYRRRNFRNVLGRRPSTAPASTTTIASTSTATEKQREAEGDVPEEYMYLAGVPPVEAGQEQRVEIHEEPMEEEVDHEDEIVEEEDAPIPMVPREAVSAHLATDDKTALARLREGGSAPEDHLPSEGPSVPTWTEEEDDDEIEYEDMDVQPQDEKSASGSGLREASSLFPALPPITSAHLFVPNGEVSPPMYPVESSSRALPSDEKMPSAPPASVPSAPPEESGIAAPSAPPLAEEDLAMMVPSAPPADHD